jgi:hypothetical protein
MVASDVASQFSSVSSAVDEGVPPPALLMRMSTLPPASTNDRSLIGFQHRGCSHGGLPFGKSPPR